jgi:hypothetical protein
MAVAAINIDATGALLPPSNVVQALSRVLADLPGIGKGDRASQQQGGYAYRGIEAITKEAAPLFAKHGVVFVPHVLSWERDEITVNSKPWTDDRMTISYTVYGPGGPDDCIEVGPIPAIGRDNSDKGANKCMTQAFKYALLQVLCIADAKDDGDASSIEAEFAGPMRSAPSGPVGPLTAEQISSMKPRELHDALLLRQLEAEGTTNEMRDRLFHWSREASGVGEPATGGDDRAGEPVAASPAPVSEPAAVAPLPDSTEDGASQGTLGGGSPGIKRGEGYDGWPRLDLVAECASREIDHPQNATKPTLVEKLRAHDRHFNLGAIEPAERPW